MKIKFLALGPTDIPYLKEGIDHYLKRLAHYVPLEMICISGIRTGKPVSPDHMKELEGERILRHLAGVDMAILLDEKGKQMTSTGFSDYLQGYMNRGLRSLAFVSGGAFGFSHAVYDRVREMISLSSMTFPHQLVRLIFLEQLYRAFTILKSESYHHI